MWVEYNANPRGKRTGDCTVRGMDAEKAWLVLDELMETLLAINPRLYNGVIRQLNA